MCQYKLKCYERKTMKECELILLDNGLVLVDNVEYTRRRFYDLFTMTKGM